MTAKDILLTAQKFTRDNSSTILTALGASGVITTAYLTAKASFKASRVLSEEPPMPAQDAVKRVWKLYIPAVLTGGVTIASVIGASKIQARRTAAITAAYSLSERAFVEYRDKVIETLGDKKEQKVRDEIASARVADNPPPSTTLVLAGPGDVLCYEMHTGRYFSSNMETLRQAVNTINAKLNREMEATLSDFYYEIGLPQTSSSSYSGWNSDKLMDLSFTTVLHDGRPCLAFEYNYVKAV